MFEEYNNLPGKTDEEAKMESSKFTMGFLVSIAAIIMAGGFLVAFLRIFLRIAGF